MSIYKISERLLDCIEQSHESSFSAIIFDCDGVLIDATKSYDLSVEVTVRAFGASLGVKIGDVNQMYRALELLRNLGTFNNDWESVAVIVAFLFELNSDRKVTVGTNLDAPLSTRMRDLETSYLRSLSNEPTSMKYVVLDELISFLESCRTGQTTEDIFSALIRDREARKRFSRNFISYPAPVGEGLLSTFFDEVMYGKAVFKETYGLDCVTSVLSDPGNIANEKVLVRSEALSDLQRLCNKNLGMITGRPKVPTIHTLRGLFQEYFPRQELCVFTGENLLDTEEVKPSPKPLLRVLGELANKESPVMYVGDSEEDLLMVERTNHSKPSKNQKILFAAIAPTRQRAEFFEERGGRNVDCIVSSINELPKALLGETLWAEAVTQTDSGGAET